MDVHSIGSSGALSLPPGSDEAPDPVGTIAVSTRGMIATESLDSSPSGVDPHHDLERHQLGRRLRQRRL